MKTYFCKFLPVEGEIKEDDRYRVKGTDKVLIANKHFKEIDQSLLEKVKLFLCSRDIQVGDKVLDEEFCEWTVLESDMTENI